VVGALEWGLLGNAWASKLRGEGRWVVVTSKGKSMGDLGRSGDDSDDEGGEDGDGGVPLELISVPRAPQVGGGETAFVVSTFCGC